MKGTRIPDVRLAEPESPASSSGWSGNGGKSLRVSRPCPASPPRGPRGTKLSSSYSRNAGGVILEADSAWNRLPNLFQSCLVRTTLILAMICSQAGDPCLVATIPEGIDAAQFCFSSDGKSVAYAARKGQQHWVTLGDWNSTPSAFAGFPVLPANGKDVVYVSFRLEHTEIRLNDTVPFETGNPREAGGFRAWTGLFRWKGGGRRIRYGRHRQERRHHQRETSDAAQGDPPAHDERRRKSSPPHWRPDDDTASSSTTSRGPPSTGVTQPALSADGKVIAYGAETDAKSPSSRGTRRPR